MYFTCVGNCGTQNRHHYHETATGAIAIEVSSEHVSHHWEAACSQHRSNAQRTLWSGQNYVLFTRFLQVAFSSRPVSLAVSRVPSRVPSRLQSTVPSRVSSRQRRFQGGIRAMFPQRPIGEGHGPSQRRCGPLEKPPSAGFFKCPKCSSGPFLSNRECHVDLGGPNSRSESAQKCNFFKICWVVIKLSCSFYPCNAHRRNDKFLKCWGCIFNPTLH